MINPEWSSPGPNESLIGKPGSRAALMTPCLVLDATALRRNIRVAMDGAREVGCSLRPHAKTHKCVEIARLQIGAGAQGISVVNIGEAEVFSSAGVSDMLITSPLVTENKFARLIRLLQMGHRVAVVIDNIDLARSLAAYARYARTTVPAYLDIDMGRHRTGVSTVEATVNLGRYLMSAECISFAGLQAYAGHLSHIADFAERSNHAHLAASRIREHRAALLSNGIPVNTLSGGSTGTFVLDIRSGVYTELQIGSYIFNDTEYEQVDFDGHRTMLFEASLFVRTTVISRNQHGLATTDAGHKHFSGSRSLPRIASPRTTSDRYEPRSDEHGAILFPAEEYADLYSIGDAIECIVPHCDPTVNLYDNYHVVEGDTLIDIWPVNARGAF